MDADAEALRSVGLEMVGTLFIDPMLRRLSIGVRSFHREKPKYLMGSRGTLPLCCSFVFISLYE